MIYIAKILRRGQYFVDPTSLEPIDHNHNGGEEEVPIAKLVTFLERVPASRLSSLSKIGTQSEPLTHAF